jgi:hypothetical protein
MNRPFTYNLQQNPSRNDFDVSLSWGEYEMHRAVKDIDTADQLRKSFRADCERKFRSSQVCAAGRLD